MMLRKIDWPALFLVSYLLLLLAVGVCVLTWLL
jgi:hypothetical protein